MLHEVALTSDIEDKSHMSQLVEQDMSLTHRGDDLSKCYVVSSERIVDVEIWTVHVKWVIQ